MKPAHEFFFLRALGAGVPENEFSIMTLTRFVGINVPEVRLIGIDAIRNLPEDIGSLSGQALAVKRFDRSDDGGVVGYSA